MKKAVALKYTAELPAPFLVSKGKNELAKRLCTIAREHGITVLQDTEAADSLFQLEVGSFIPEYLYELIAEILSFVFTVDYGKKASKQDFV